VAIEQRKKFAQDVAVRAARRGLTNVLVVQGDARLLAPRLFRSGSLAAIHVHFPDPWWKRRHHRRRIVDDAVSGLLFRLLAPEGELDLRTDVERYAIDALEWLEPLGFANSAGAGHFSDRHPEEIPSTREKRYLSSGQRVWRIRLVKSR
jgi:tRNA (guanine-N7-)-methyltransferase